MLNPIVSFTVFFIEMLIIYVFYSRIFESRYSVWKNLLIGMLLFSCASLTNLVFKNNAVINNVISTIIYFVFAILCFEIQIRAAAIFAILLEVLNFAIEIMTVLMIAPFTSSQSIDVNNNPAFLILVILTSKMLLFVLCVLLLRLIAPQVNRVKVPVAFLFYPVALLICLLLSWRICLFDDVTWEIQKSIAVNCVLFFVATVILFIIYQHHIEENSRQIQMENEILQLQTERSYYKVLEQQNENLLLYSHDVKKHLAAIAALSENQEINSYIEKLTEQLKKYSKNYHSGNKLLDVMINKYCLTCESEGLHFSYDVRQCNLRELQDIDLVAILGNLMDNAVRFAEESQKKEILLETTIRNDYSVLIISNSCDTPPKTNGTHLLTTKPNTQLHGYGIKNVMKALKPYGGDLNWEYNSDTRTFIMTVMLES